MQGLGVGRIVHYVMKDGAARPLMVVRVWESGPHDGYLNGVLFIDGLNDQDNIPNSLKPAEARGCEVWVTSTWYDESRPPGTWHWPPKA